MNLSWCQNFWSNLSWIFKSFCDATADDTHKMAIFKKSFHRWSGKYLKNTQRQSFSNASDPLENDFMIHVCSTGSSSGITKWYKDPALLIMTLRYHFFRETRKLSFATSLLRGVRYIYRLSNHFKNYIILI